MEAVITVAFLFLFLVGALLFVSRWAKDWGKYPRPAMPCKFCGQAATHWFVAFQTPKGEDVGGWACDGHALELAEQGKTITPIQEL